MPSAETAETAETAERCRDAVIRCDPICEYLLYIFKGAERAGSGLATAPG